MSTGKFGLLGHVADVLTTEGAAALCDRLRDHWRARRRKSLFRLRDRPPAKGLRIPALVFLPTPPVPRLGGVQAQLLLRLETLEALKEPYALLYPESPGRYRLEVSAAGYRWAQEQAGPRISVPRLHVPALSETLQWAMKSVDAEILHFEHFGAAPLSAAIAMRSGTTRLVLSAHDFGLFCPRPHLLEQPFSRFCGYSQNMQRCARCLRQTWPLLAGYQRARRAIARELLATADAVIFPSSFLRDAYQRLLASGLASERQLVIEPPVKSTPVGRHTVPTVSTRKRDGNADLHVAYVGSFQPHKGSEIFEQVVVELREDRRFVWSVFGSGDRAALGRLRSLGVQVRGYYRWGTLSSLLQRHRVDLVLVLSIVPESFGLTLTEARRAAVPVLAFDHGAIAERVREVGDGVLVPPAAEVDGVVETLRGLAEDRCQIESLARPGLVDGKTPEQQVRALLSLYRALRVP